MQAPKRRWLHQLPRSWASCEDDAGVLPTLLSSSREVLEVLERREAVCCVPQEGHSQLQELLSLARTRRGIGGKRTIEVRRPHDGRSGDTRDLHILDDRDAESIVDLNTSSGRAGDFDLRNLIGQRHTVRFDERRLSTDNVTGFENPVNGTWPYEGHVGHIRHDICFLLIEGLIATQYMVYRAIDATLSEIRHELIGEPTRGHLKLLWWSKGLYRHRAEGQEKL